MIVKVQLSLESSDGVRRVLVYNRDRSVLYEEEATPDVIEEMGGQLKVFCNAAVLEDGTLDVMIDDRVPDPGW